MRTSHKMAPHIPKYGESSKKKKLTRGRKASKELSLDDIFNDDINPKSKKFKKFMDQADKARKEEDKERQLHLMKSVPALKEVKKQVDAKLFDKLLSSLIEELDNAIRKGRDSAPSGSSGGSSRADTWSGPPAGSFILTPYTNYNY